MGIIPRVFGLDQEPTPEPAPSQEAQTAAAERLEAMAGQRLDAGEALFYRMDGWNKGERLGRVNQILNIVDRAEPLSDQAVRRLGEKYDADTIEAMQLFQLATTADGYTREEGLDRLRKMRELIEDSPFEGTAMDVTVTADTHPAEQREQTAMEPRELPDQDKPLD